MWISKTITDLRRQRNALTGTVVLVPTMGALHEGHVRHINTARRIGDHVIVSIFVNPTQFVPGEDYQRYPRPLEQDLAECETHGADGVFCPSAGQMYPSGQPATAVNVPSLANLFEGRSRPGHFAGVCRVITKLFNIVQPDIATFGKKDYQQLLIVQTLVADLDIPVRIEPIETVRDASGTAISSRHCYLSPTGRERARSIYEALQTARSQVEAHHETDPRAMESAMAQTLQDHQIQVDYAAVCHPQTLATLDCLESQLTGGVVALIAGYIEGIRLIDNMVLAGGSDAKTGA